MAFYDKFPYTNFQELNLDWITQEVSKVRDNRDASDASAAAALASEKAAKASETAAASSQQAAANSETAAAGSEAASADYLAQIGTHTAGAVADWLKENIQPTTPAVDASLSVSGAAADAKKTGDAVNDLKSHLDATIDDVTVLKDQMVDMSETAEYEDPYSAVYLAPYHIRYVTPTGTIEAYDDFVYTDKIPVKPGYVLTGITTDHTQHCQLRTVCAFNGDTAVPSAGNSSDHPRYTVPEGIDYVIVTQRGSVQAGKTRSVEINGMDIKTATNVKANPMGYMLASGNMSDGDILHVRENNVKNEVVVTFFANITAFNSIAVGQRTDKGWGDCYVEVDDTNLTIHTDLGVITVPHGLTIGSDIQIMIRTEQDASTSLIRVASDGVFFDEITPHRWLCDEGYASAVSNGSTLTDCVLSWTSRRINSPIWIFGDSYISLYPSRWVTYLYKDGFNKSFMLNGYAGEISSAAMRSLRNLLTDRKPQYIFWILGMNDPDSSTAVNTSWKENYDLLINLCKKWNITPVLGTIPSIPGATNEFKNAIIRASGYRYVDFAKAVDPSGTGNWISGTLGADQVHPTANGAKVLYMRALADFPELTSHF